MGFIWDFIWDLVGTLYMKTWDLFGIYNDEWDDNGFLG